MAQELPLPPWPNDAEVAVSLTFDVDAESGWLGEGVEEYSPRLTTLSEGRFGVVRGLPRIVELLEEFSIPATFYVPGDTAERHTEAIQNLVERGHEIGHHGHLHLRSDRISADLQRQEIELGLAALDSRLALRPAGYRSASWELTPETFALLLEYGFAYDSSCMGDDRPYIEELDGGSILELPVHWSLDDWPYFEWTIDAGGNTSNAHDFERNWLDELDGARRDRRHVTYTMHPEVIGRGYRIAALRRFLEAITDQGSIWFATHAQVAERVGSGSAVDDRNR
jgi:peptidoglycan/xylan/chitin deacetylase (PgdA/CDA1 family)